MGQKSKKFQKLSGGSDFPLGCTFRPGKVNIAVYLPREEGCTLRIYEQGSKEPSFVASMDRSQNAPVYSAEIALPDKRVYEYTLETASGEFADPCAPLFSGVSTFGDKPSGNIRGIIDQKDFWCADDVRPMLSPDSLIVYKLHVRGFTMEAPGVRHKGTFKGLSEKIGYLSALGVNAVLLMPCTEFNELMDSPRRIGPETAEDKKRSLKAASGAEGVQRVNFWGYGAEGCYFAPKASYASVPEKANAEFSRMISDFHKASMEVYMELSFAAGTPMGTMLQAARYWAARYHVDGFRFNTDAIPAELFAADPYLASVKLFYGNSENYQTDMRRFLKGDENMAGSAAAHLKESGFGRVLALNCITDNNGFTLNDLYSYDTRHNEENHENNRDGREINYSWNCGEEGETKSTKVRELRKRMQKNALAAMLLGQGIPMLLAGDEFCNSQGGNNNAYCCDNRTGWVNWNRNKQAAEILSFTRELIDLRRKHPVFHNPAKLLGTDFLGSGAPDVSFHGTRAWYPDYGYFSRTLGMLLNGTYASTGDNSRDRSFLVIFNMHWESHDFDLPDILGNGSWERVISTDSTAAVNDEKKVCTLGPRSVIVLARLEEPVVRKPIKRAKRG